MHKFINLTSVSVGISVLLINGAITGCAQPIYQTELPSTNTDNKIPTKVSYPSSTSDWVDLLPGKTTRDFTFSQRGELLYQGRTLLSKIPVSYVSDGTVVYAQLLIVSPNSPSGRYNIIKACEGTTEDKSLCWSIYKIDRTKKTAQKVSIGKYGSRNWVQWSKNDRYAVFSDSLEGTSRFIVMDLATGKTQYGSELSAQPDLKSFRWTGDRTFNVNLSNGSNIQENIQALFSK